MITDGMNELVLDLQAELQEFAAIDAESIGWLPLGEGAKVLRQALDERIGRLYPSFPLHQLSTLSSP